MPMDNETHLPCQIECVLNPGIHALTARRTVNIRRITRKKDPSESELVDLALGDMEPRKPDRVAQLYALTGPSIYKGLHLGQLRFAPFGIFFPIPYRSNYAAAFRSKWKNPYD